MAATEIPSYERNSSETCFICNHGIDTTVIVLQILFGCFTVIGNVLTLVTLNRCHELRWVMRLCLSNLAIDGIGLGLVFVYHSSVLYYLFKDPLECYLRYLAVCVLTGINMFTVMELSIERVIAFKLPFRHNEIVNTKTLIIAGVTSWLGPLITVLSVFRYKADITECNYLLISDQFTDILFGALNLTFIAVTCACHVTLLNGVRSQIQKIVPVFVGEKKRQKEIEMKMKATRATVLVLLPPIVCTTPQFLLFLSAGIHPSLKGNPYSHYIMNALFNLTAAASLVNPFVYIWNLPEMRQTLKKMLGIKTTLN